MQVKRLSRLDGLRGVLAVYVMLGHAMPFTALPHWVAGPFSHGEAAVDLFFALSGLVIVNSLEHFDYRFWRFIRARAWRLLPVYFAVLALALALYAWPLPALPWLGVAAAQIQPAGLPRPLVWHLAVHLTLTQGLLPQGVLPYAFVTLLGPAWSLSTEWQFYVLIALVLPLLPGPWRLQVFALALLMLGITFHLLAPHLPAFWQFSRAFLPDAAAFFGLGLASAVWLRGGGAALLLLCLVAAVGLGLLGGEPAKALVPLGWALALLVQRHRHFPLLGALLDSQAAQYLGAISYPLYLLNEPVQRGCALLLAPWAAGRPWMFTASWLPLVVMASIASAALLHHGLEMPSMKGPARPTVPPRRGLTSAGGPKYRTANEPDADQAKAREGSYPRWLRLP